MCQKKPGPRCASHLFKQLEKLSEDMESTQKTADRAYGRMLEALLLSKDKTERSQDAYLERSQEYSAAVVAHDKATAAFLHTQFEYDGTPSGQNALESALASGDESAVSRVDRSGNPITGERLHEYTKRARAYYNSRRSLNFAVGEIMSDSDGLFNRVSAYRLRTKEGRKMHDALAQLRTAREKWKSTASFVADTVNEENTRNADLKEAKAELASADVKYETAASQAWEAVSGYLSTPMGHKELVHRSDRAHQLSTKKPQEAKRSLQWAEAADASTRPLESYYGPFNQRTVREIPLPALI